jgi:Mg2+ and Co2+ transporter CorA
MVGLTKEVKASMEQWFSTLKEEIMDKFQQLCEKIEEKMEKLEVENAMLKQRVEAMEQYSRGDTLEIGGVPVVEDEDLEKTILDIEGS